MMKLIIIVIGYIYLYYAFALLSQCTSHAFYFNILGSVGKHSLMKVARF